MSTRVDSYKVSLGNAVVILYFTVPQDNRDAGWRRDLFDVDLDGEQLMGNIQRIRQESE